MWYFFLTLDQFLWFFAFKNLLKPKITRIRLMSKHTVNLMSRKKNQWNKKDILTLQKIKSFNRLSVPFLSLKCYVDDGSYEVRVSREKMYILYKWIKSKRNTFFPMVNLWFLNQHATNPVENSFVTILLKPSTHNESPYRTYFSQSKSFFIIVSTECLAQLSNEPVYF